MYEEILEAAKKEKWELQGLLSAKSRFFKTNKKAIVKVSKKVNVTVDIYSTNKGETTLIVSNKGKLSDGLDALCKLFKTK